MPAVSPPGFAELRAAARAGFAGLPGRKTEHWKYTSVRPIQKATLRPADGVVSVVKDVPAGVYVGPLSGMGGGREAVAAQLGQHAALDGHPFAALNTVGFGDPWVVHLPRGASASAPVEISWRTVAEQALWHPRLLIVAEAQSEVTVIERFEGEGEGAALINAVTEVVVGPGARVRHAKVQTERPGAFHVGRVHAAVDRDGGFEHGLLNLGGALARTEITVLLNAPGAETRLNGLFAGADRQHLDQHIRVEHRSPRAESHQLFRGILADRARGVFTGRVVVAEGARKSAAFQKNPNLLLSPTAHVDTRPQLEIYNDDVQCSHGATVGRLDADALFYLQSRGLDPETARRMLTAAFAADVIAALPTEALRDFATGWMTERVVGGA